ncbi:MAG: hypothetical protein JNM93_06400 [Bacteriovoracaceae bacterium]|nr:hypothetical protein [Bacteriovoracaceae bacterium]
MQDIRQIIQKHRSKKTDLTVGPQKKPKTATISEIPDLFFDEILVNYKLTRIEILTLMYLYRMVYCRPNIYEEHGVSPIFKLSEMAITFQVEEMELRKSIYTLENFRFIETIREGQYFVRKYFTEDNDKAYGQSYDSFL